MIKNETLNITTPSERELTWTRIFNAPRKMVFDAHTKPELIRRWLLGPDGWTMIVCDVDLKVGGKFRYVWKHEERGEMGMGGEFLEIADPHKIVNTELFDEAWYTGIAQTTMELTDLDGATRMTVTTLYESKDSRDQVLKSKMETGLTASYNRLAELVSSL